MSVQVAMAVVGTVLGAKTAIDGLKEGNILKAVVGGVGAYFGASGIGNAMSAGGQSASQVAGTAAGATGKTAAATAGANVGDKFAAVQGMSGMGKTAATSGSSIAGNGAGMAGLHNSVMSSGAGIGEVAATLSPAQLASSTAGGAAITNGLHAAHTANAGLLGGLRGSMGRLNDWVSNNQMLALGGMQMGGGLLQGLGEQKRFDEQVRLAEEDRRRRGTTAVAPYGPTARFNPSTGRFEEVV